MVAVVLAFVHREGAAAVVVAVENLRIKHQSSHLRRRCCRLRGGMVVVWALGCGPFAIRGRGRRRSAREVSRWRVWVSGRSL
jgi:hypothetical protein